MEMELTKEERQALEKIQLDKLKGTYLYLIYLSQGLKGIEAKQTDKKTKLSFRYFTKDGQYPFSFIVNNRWLLFYFKGSDLDFSSIEKELQQHNIDFKYNPSGEITVRIEDEKPLPVIKKLLIDYCS
ncbi:MAG: hypothetical protein GY797_16745 [Deltaproteobacteria bacterium]|nr:hypothetical protein [Deltaproteobacteria bacterium]